MAMDDNLRLLMRIEFRGAGHQLTHRYQLRAVDVDQVIFILLATIQQEKFRAPLIQAGFGCLTVGFERERSGHGRLGESRKWEFGSKEIRGRRSDSCAGYF